MFTSESLNNNVEVFCIKVLEDVIDRVIGMQKKEKPDWQGNDIGIEVVRAMKLDGGISNFFSKNKGKQFNQISNKDLAKFGFACRPKKEGQRYIQRNNQNYSLLYSCDDNNNLILQGYSDPRSNSLNEIKGAVIEKLKKLNKNYTIFKENDLAVLIPEHMDYMICGSEIRKTEIDKIIVDLKSLYSNQYGHYFDYIFLIYYDYLFELCTKTWEYKEYKITSSTIKNYDTIINSLNKTNKK